MSTRPEFNKILTVLAIWLALAVVVGASGALAAFRPPFPQLVLLALTAGVLLLFAKSDTFHHWAMAVDIRALIGFHVTRFVGLYFLYLHSIGQLPFAFAVPGGCGDVAVAFLALGVIGLGKHLGARAPTAYLGWNIIGLIDILFVVATAARLALANPASMSALTRLPLSLLITFVVPIIIATHVIIFIRLVKENRSQSRASSAH